MSVAAAVVAGSVVQWGAGLAQLAADAQPERGDVKPGWVALVIVLVLCVVTALLWLNMRKQLGKISFEEEEIPRRRSGEPPAS